MTTTGELFPRCALPGCANPTDTQGHPCEQCRRDFGPMLRHNPGGQPMTAAAQTARDHDVALAYRAQEQLRIDAAEQHVAIRTGQQDKARTDLLAVRGTPKVRPHQRAVGMPNLPLGHWLTDQPEGAQRSDLTAAQRCPGPVAPLRSTPDPGRVPPQVGGHLLRAHVDQV